MQTLRLSTGAAALAVGSLAVFGMASPVLAQQGGGNGNGGANNPSECGVQNPAGKYPPGQCKRQGNSNNNPRPGQQMTVSTDSGEFDSGSRGEHGVQSTYRKLGNFTADSTGAATVTFAVPRNLEAGQHNTVFKGVFNGQPKTVSVPFTVASAGAAGNNAATPSSLPFTGSDDLIPLTLVGAGMVALGAGVVVAARRRRSDLPSNVA